MSEFSRSPEHASQAALHEYLSTDTHLPLGGISPQKLEAWQAALAGQRLKPDQQLHAAWITIEHAFSYSIDRDDASESRTETGADLVAAEKLLSLLIGKAGINRITEAQAILAYNSLPIIRSLILDDRDAFLNGYEAFYNGQIDAAKLVLKNYERYGNVSDIPLLHSLAVMAIVTQEVHNQLFVLPAPPRALQSTNAKDAWSMTILHRGRATQNLFNARVASTSPRGFLSIPPALLRNDQYPSSHGHGTLQAFLTDHARRDVPRYVRDPRDRDATTQIKRYTPEDRHIQQVSDALHEHIYELIDKRIPTDILHEIPDDPALIYLDVDANEHSSLLPGTTLDKLISIFEVGYCGGELSPRNGLILGWMHIESGLKAVAEQQVTDSIGGTFDRAGEIFGTVASKFFENGQVGQGYEALVSLAAAEMYQAVCLSGDNEELVEEKREDYVAQLTDISEEMLQRFAELKDYSTPEAHSLHAALYVVSALLATNVGTGGGHVAVPSTPRQRGVTERNNTGWDISVLPLTGNGFKADYYGKLRIANSHEQRHTDSNIVTISTNDLNPDNSFVVLRHGMDIADKRELDANQQVIFDKAVAKITRAAELSEW